MSKTENQKNCKMRRVDSMTLAVPPSFISSSQWNDWQFSGGQTEEKLKEWPSEPDKPGQELQLCHLEYDMASARKFSKFSAPSRYKVIAGIEWDTIGTYYKAWYIVTLYILRPVIIIVSISEVVVMNQKASWRSQNLSWALTTRLNL